MTGRVCVSGADGFVGKVLVRHFADRGWHVTALHRRQPDCSNGAIHRVQCDLSAGPISIPEELDFVVHAAARSPAHGGSEADFERDNALVTKRFVERAIERGCKRFVLLSAISAFGSVNVDVLSEQVDPVDPDCYGRSKLRSEAALAAHAEALPSLSLRLPGIVGKGAVRPWLARCVETLRVGGTVTAFNPTSRFNNVIHVSDLAEFLVGVARMNLSGADMVTLAAADPAPISDILTVAQQELGGVGRVEFSPDRSHAFTISSDAAMDRYGYEPRPTLDVVRRFSQEALKQGSAGR